MFVVFLEKWPPVAMHNTCFIFVKVRPPINGNWGAWKEWTACSAACNGGTRRRSRFCDAPIPAHGGSECPGDQKVNETCNTQACPSEWHAFNSTFISSSTKGN